MTGVRMRLPSGFTLLEVLIALAIMATLALTGYRALTGMLDVTGRKAPVGNIDGGIAM